MKTETLTPRLIKQMKNKLVEYNVSTNIRYLFFSSIAVNVSTISNNPTEMLTPVLNNTVFDSQEELEEFISAYIDFYNSINNWLEELFTFWEDDNESKLYNADMKNIFLELLDEDDLNNSGLSLMQEELEILNLFVVENGIIAIDEATQKNKMGELFSQVQKKLGSDEEDFFSMLLYNIFNDLNIFDQERIEKNDIKIFNDEFQDIYKDKKVFNSKLAYLFQSFIRTTSYAYLMNLKNN